MNKQELMSSLTNEQIEKARQCKNNDELLKLAKDEGIELTDEQLESISGGGLCRPTCCPRCSFIWIDVIEPGYYRCAACGKTWHEGGDDIIEPDDGFHISPK